MRFLFITSLIAKGGFGLWLTRPAWGAYWRQLEYKADEYATRLGQADELADFLEIHALIHDHPVPFIWLTQHTTPQQSYASTNSATPPWTTKHQRKTPPRLRHPTPVP